MKTLFGTLLLSLTLSVASGHARAEEEAPRGSHGAPAAHGEGHGGEHGGFDAKTFGLQVFNFAVLLVILVKFGGGAVGKALRQRHEQLKKDLAEANESRNTALARLKEQEGRLQNLEKEVSTLRARLKQEAEAEKARLVAAAEERARRIQDETRFLLDQQVKDAELRFRAEVAAAAARVAEELVRAQVNAGDQSRLTQTFIADVESARS